MVKVEELKEKEKKLKAKLMEAMKAAKNPIADPYVRALRKQLKRTQRKRRFMSGQKLETIKKRKTAEVKREEKK